MGSKFSKSLKPVNLAASERWGEIDWAGLKEKDITEFDSQGNTLLHYAAKKGYWESLPKRLRDKKFWKDSKNGDSIYMCAFYGPNLHWVNMQDLTLKDILKKNRQSQSILTNAIASKIFGRIPKNLISSQLLSSGHTGQDLVVHSVTRLGQFGQIQKKHLTHELLSLRGSYTESVYHILALEHDMRYLPKELITREALTLATDSGITPLHTVAEFEWELIPPTITLEDVCRVAIGGQTPLHSWASGGGWREIPEKFLTRESLSLKNRHGDTPLSILSSQFENLWYANFEGNVKLRQKVETLFKRILTKVGAKDLQSLAKMDALVPLVKAEVGKRRIMEELSQQSAGLTL